MCQASGKAYEEAGRDEPPVPSTHSESGHGYSSHSGLAVMWMQSVRRRQCAPRRIRAGHGDPPSQGNQGRLHRRGHTQATPCKLNVDTGKTQHGVPGVANNTSRGPKVGKWKECVGKDKYLTGQEHVG